MTVLLDEEVELQQRRPANNEQERPLLNDVHWSLFGAVTLLLHPVHVERRIVELPQDRWQLRKWKVAIAVGGTSSTIRSNFLLKEECHDEQFKFLLLFKAGLENGGCMCPGWQWTGPASCNHIVC